MGIPFGTTTVNEVRTLKQGRKRFVPIAAKMPSRLTPAVPGSMLPPQLRIGPTTLETLAADRQELIKLTNHHEWLSLRAYVLEMLARISPEGSAGPLTQWLVECSEQACVPPRDIEALALRHGGSAAIRHAFREKNASELNRLKIVPIGSECHPWVILNRWGFRSTLDDLNHLCLGIHRMPALVDMLEERFSNYASSQSITTRNHPPSGEDMVVDPKNGITWNHHRGAYWTDENFARLRETMPGLISNFHRSCRKPGAIFAISQWKDFDAVRSAPLLDRLMAGLTLNGASDPKLIIMDFSGAEPDGVLQVRDNVCLCSNVYPDGYSWSGMNYYNSEVGVAWERRVVANFLEAVSRI